MQGHGVSVSSAGEEALAVVIERETQDCRAQVVGDGLGKGH
jgi:hypothetical protein